jgi:hypothetical protein
MDLSSAVSGADEAGAVSGLKGLVENRLADPFDNKEGRFFGILRFVGDNDPGMCSAAYSVSERASIHSTCFPQCCTSLSGTELSEGTRQLLTLRW